MSAHTPGPWTACDWGDYSDYDGKCAVILGDDVRVAVALGFETAENKANAQLIAAAPELLEALKYARRMVRASECDIAFIDAAIAKATGAKP